MTDPISRADAIEAVQKIVPYVIDKDTGQWGILVNKANIITELEALPSADAVHGEWTDIDNYYRLATCSHCHKVTMFEKWGEYTRPYNYCPNCGSRMKGGAE